MFWACNCLFVLFDFKTLMTLCTALLLCFRYDEELGVVYMAARLAGGYAAVRRALNEVMTIWTNCTCIGSSFPDEVNSCRVFLSDCFFSSAHHRLKKEIPHLPLSLSLILAQDLEQLPGEHENTSTAKETCYVSHQTENVFFPQGITLVLGWYFEGDGVRRQLRANEYPGRATSQRCTHKHCYQFCLGFSQKRALVLTLL